MNQTGPEERIPVAPEKLILDDQRAISGYYKPSLGAILAGIIPFAALCFSVPLWDRIHPFVLGLPFNIFWIITWMILTPLCLLAAHRIEASRLAPKNGAGNKGKDPQ